MNLESQAGRMRLGQILLTLTAALLMLVAFAFFRSPDAAIEVERPGTGTASVVVSEVGVQPFELSVAVIGRVSPWREVSIASEVGGRLDDVRVDIGARVAAGDELARIEPDDYETAVREAEAALLRAEARLEESTAALNRMDALRRRGAVSEREYEAALATKRATEADLASAEAGLERAHDNLDDTRIVAPFAGTIVERHVDPGALVSPERTLLVLANLDTVAIEAGLTEREVFLVHDADAALVAHPNRPGWHAEGIIDGLAERADPATGTYSLRIRVDNRDPEGPRFLGGMVVELEVPYADLEAVATVPAAAVITPDRDPHVFVIRDGHARRIDVEVVARDQDRIGVSPRGAAGAMANGDGTAGSGAFLRLGESVVIVGQTQLSDGAEVRIASQR